MLLKFASLSQFLYGKTRQFFTSLATCFDFEGELSLNRVRVASRAASPDPAPGQGHSSPVSAIKPTLTVSRNRHGSQRHITELGFVNKPTSPLSQREDPPMGLVGCRFGKGPRCPAGASSRLPHCHVSTFPNLFLPSPPRERFGTRQVGRTHHFSG